MASTPRKSRFPVIAFRLLIFAALVAGGVWGGKRVWKQIGPGLFGMKREARISTTQVKTANIAEEIIAVGRLRAVFSTELRAEINGRITKISAVDGQTLKRNDEILRLDEDEMDLASGMLEVPDDALLRRARRALESLPRSEGPPPPPPDAPSEREWRRALLEERLLAAMDGVPEGWMVRSARTGGAEVKAFAGVGAAGPTAPAARFGPELEVGPGWVRSGNRRRVNASDGRTCKAAAQGPEDGACTFLARPWAESARWFMGEDPHRHGREFAGKGVWPAEWRAFVEAGRVVGVSAYYAWATGAGPEDARMAVEVRGRAQAIVDEAVATRAWPRMMELEFARSRPDGGAGLGPKVAADLALFGREAVGCTLDFVEVEGRGPVFLEGGPAHTILGGGAPVAFTGCGGPLALGRNRARVEGVAFRLMDHVCLTDPKTWADGDRSGRIVSWEEAEAMAAA